ncbi:MAG TPA: hypothetical protein PKD91_07465, partial [Bacteroidia bacterium]|nr:hypothetical protein [Bacteroidia bacterium]
MNRLRKIVPLLLILTLALSATMSYGAVTVTPASGLCLNVSPGGYTGIGNIVIDENNNNDIANQVNGTIILTAPAGFQFLAGTGTVTYTGSRNITSASIVVAAGTITVTFSCGGTNRDDQITIGGIQARATAGGASGSIFRTGGTASISGDASGGGVNHGTLTASNAGVTITSAAAGNWSAGATWVGGVVPSCGAHVVIAHNVTVNVAANAKNLTINSGVTLTGNNAVTVAGTFTILGTGTYIHDNGSSAATTIFAGTESFSTTSTIRINQWYNTGAPLATNVTGNFGNIIF